MLLIPNRRQSSISELHRISTQAWETEKLIPEVCFGKRNFVPHLDFLASPKPSA